MRIAVLSDIHSNLEALIQVLNFLDKKDIKDTICCGDIVGYGPNPNQCIKLLKEKQVQCVTGNHDAAALSKESDFRLNQVGRQAINWTRGELGKDSRMFLEQLPTTYQFDDFSLALVHGSPADHLWGRILKKKDAYLAFRLANKEYHLQVFGHTHLPTLFALKGEGVYRETLTETKKVTLSPQQRYLINPGSVGQPRDGDWRASLCILHLGNEDWVEFHRLEYEVEKTRKKIFEADLPKKLGNRLLSGV